MSVRGHLGFQGSRSGFRVATLVACAIALAPVVASAQEVLTPSLASLTAAPLFELAQTQAPIAAADAPRLDRVKPAGSRGVLLPLYASFATLQLLDAHSTLRAVRAGAVEQNPMVGSMANHPAALVAMKAGVAASTIVLADKMRNRSRVGAIVLMAGLNSLYATVVAHNYSVR
jgi:hypothetical protein